MGLDEEKGYQNNFFDLPFVSAQFKCKFLVLKLVYNLLYYIQRKEIIGKSLPLVIMKV